MRSFLLRIPVLLLLVTAVANAYGSSVTTEIGNGPIDLGPQLLLFEDSAGDMTVDDVAALPDASFNRNEKGTPNFGITDSTWWAKLNLQFAAGDQERHILEYATAFTDRVTLFVSDESGGWKIMHAGDQVAHASLTYNYPTYLFPLPSGSKHLTLFLRLNSDGPLDAPVRLWREGELVNSAARSQLAYGLFYAVMLGLLGYNLLLYLVVRDVNYLLYIGYLGGICAFQATMHGHTQAYLWPADQPLFNPLSVMFLFIGIASGMHFARLITDSVALAPIMHRLLNFGAWLALAFVPALALFYPQLIQAVPPISVISIALILHTVVLCSLRGSRSAKLVLIAFLTIVPGGIALALRNLGLIEPGILSDHGLQIGTALEAILLSLVLADRINTLKQARDEARTGLAEAQQQALIQQQRFSRSLLRAQDDERKRIAQELHDGVGQVMLAIVNGLRRISGIAPEARDLESLAGDSVTDIRQISHRLHPHLLDRLGLAEALRASAKQLLAETGTQVEIEIDDSAPLNAEQKLHLYRICQEALSNSAKYASATRIVIKLELQDNFLSLVIRDNGRGFDPASVENWGLGLQNMRERSEILEGTLRLDAAQGQGCQITVNCPA